MPKRRMVVVVPEEAIADVVNFCLAHSFEMHVLKEEDDEEGVIIGPAPRYMQKGHQKPPGRPHAPLLEHRPHEPHDHPPKVKQKRYFKSGRKPQTPAQYPHTSQKDADMIVDSLFNEDGVLYATQFKGKAEELHINPSSLSHSIYRKKLRGEVERIAVGVYRKVNNRNGTKEHVA